MIIREATKEDLPKILPVWREMMEFHAQRDPHFTLCRDAEKAVTPYMLENIETPVPGFSMRAAIRHSTEF